MTQAQMFPMTEEERIAILRGNLAAEVEKRLAKRDTAAVALADAEEAEEGARGLLTVFDRMVRDRARQISEDRGGKSILETAADVVNSGALDRDGIKVTASVSPGRVADPWTCPDCGGDLAWYDKTGHTCTTCDGTGHQEPSCDNCTIYGDCNISQPQGSGTMGCGGSSWLHGETMGKPNVSVADAAPPAGEAEVQVAYPGEDHMRYSKVGEFTRYGNLVAEYLATLPADDPRREDAITDYVVFDVTGKEGVNCDVHAVIPESAHGHEFVIDPQDEHESGPS